MSFIAIPITPEAALQDANQRLGDWEGWGGPWPCQTLPEAIAALESLIGSDCECDNTHEANDTCCCLCQYRAALDPSFTP